MGKDTKRIAGPENCLSPNTFRKKETKKKLINGERSRKDKRETKDLKSISLQVGIVPSVTGSAYLECGKTKILCSVNGPRDVLHKSESSSKGQLYCEFKFASFSCKERQPYMPSNEEQTISKSIQDALEPVILLHKFPKSRLDIIILVLENDGGVISASITCAGAALSNAGVEMYDLPVGCSLVYSDSQFLVDPTAEEELFCESEENAAKIAMAMMVEYKRQVIYMDSSGSVNHLLLAESLKVLESLCLQILTDIQTCLKQHVEEMRENDGESTEGSIAKTFEEQLKLLQPQKYINAFIEHEVRPSGRTLKEFRPVMINTNSISTANGSALVRMGETSVICGIKAELCNPSTKDPNKGFFIPNVTLTSLCSNQYIPGPPTEQAQVYSLMVKDLWENSSFVDPEDLCIFEGQLSWCLFAEMTCLSHDGNIFDACILALMAALRCTKLPKVTINADTNRIEVGKESVDLKVGDFVFSASFAVLGTKAVADPSSEEETLADSTISILLDSKKNFSTRLFGRIQEEQIFECIEDAKKRYIDMKSLVDGLK